MANNTSSEVVDIPGSSVILIVNFNHKTDKTLTAEIFLKNKVKIFELGFWNAARTNLTGICRFFFLLKRFNSLWTKSYICT